MTISLFVFNSCGDDFEGTEELNYVTFGKSTYSAGVDVNGTAVVEIPVYTTNIVSSDRTFNVSVDQTKTNAAAGSYTVPTTVTVEGGKNEGILSVSLSDLNLGIGVNKLVISFDAAPELFKGGSTTINYIQNCTEVTGTLDITFDSYSSETSWEFIDSLGGVVLASPDYPDGKAPVSESITLCAGRDYTLVFYDSYGDGMNDGVNLGSYTLTIDGVVKVTGGGGFGDSESTAFDTK